MAKFIWYDTLSFSPEKIIVLKIQNHFAEKCNFTLLLSSLLSLKILKKKKTEEKGKKIQA